LSDLTEDKVARFVSVLGLDPAGDAEAALVVAIDDDWVVAINRHTHTVTVAPGGCLPISIEADEMCFWYRGWFAGWLRPARSGPGRETDIVAVEGAANVRTLRAALDAAIIRAVGRSRAPAPEVERRREPVGLAAGVWPGEEEGDPGPESARPSRHTAFGQPTPRPHQPRRDGFRECVW
jgi:hypothetical protein